MRTTPRSSPVAIQQPFGAIATAVTVHVCCVYSCTWMGWPPVGTMSRMTTVRSRA